MSVIKPTLTEMLNPGEGEAWLATWAGIGDSDTCEAVQLPGYNDRSVQVIGTFGGATITMQGSLDNTNFATIRDPSSTNLTFAAAGLKAVLEAVRWVRPSTAGGTSSSLTVLMLFAKAKR